MRHRYVGRKLGRGRTHREAMLRQTVGALFKSERIVTTVERAKDFRIFADRLITIGKKYQGAKDTAGKVHYLRLAQRYLQDMAAAKKVCTEIAPRFMERPGGYTRVLKLGGSRWSDNSKWAQYRLGDNGQRAILELVVRAEKQEEEAPAAAKGARKSKAAGGETQKETKGKAAGAGT
jgi:large subunit ribosomal protein L17